ncbi:Cytochrome c-552 [Candidatus Terasakiella magnetica]|nr:Cytochrome c-552 [Candidatus Terasakiella magnetica]
MKSTTLAAALLVGLAATPALAVDWAAVPGKDVTLFYPGQSSWEWVQSGADHGGAGKIRSGKVCRECHVSEEKEMGNTLVLGKKNEPTPPAGKPGSIEAVIKFAIEKDSLLVHLDFKEGTQPDAKMDPDFATKVTMMLGDAKVGESMQAGCWGTCHEDAAKMPAAGTAERTKYLTRTRAKPTRNGGGDELKPAEDLAQMQADGQVLEYWQARLKPGAAAVAAAGTVFDKRQEAKAGVVSAQAVQTDGGWSVTLSRKLSATAPFKELAEGKTYGVGFAIHSGHTARRFHYVSLEHVLAIGQGTADFVAVKK